MRKFFITNIIFLILLNLIIKPVWVFGIDRNVQNFVGHISYGQYQAIFSFTLIFQIFLDFGLQHFNNRSIAQSPETMQSLFPNIVWTKIFLSFSYILLIVLFGLIIGFRGHELILILLLGFVQMLNSFLLFLRSNISGMQRFKTDSIMSVLDKSLMIIFCGALLYLPPWKEHFKIEWFIYSQIAAYLISATIAFKLCLGLGTIKWNKFQPVKVLAIAKKSLPYALIIFFMSIYLRADSVMLERILPNGKEEAGIFAASFRLLDVANNMTGVLFAGILLPFFGRLIAQKERVQPIIRLSLNILLPIALTTVVVAAFWGDAIMQLLYTQAGPIDGKVFFWLICSFPGYCIGYVYATLLTANGTLKALIIVSIFATIFNLGLNFIFIPRYGVLAAAVIAAATQILLSVLNIALAKKHLKLKTDFKWLGQYFIFLSLIIACGWLIQKGNLNLFLTLALMSLSGVFVMAVIGFIPLGKLKEFLLQVKSS